MEVRMLIPIFSPSSLSKPQYMTASIITRTASSPKRVTKVISAVTAGPERDWNSVMIQLSHAK